MKNCIKIQFYKLQTIEDRQSSGSNSMHKLKKHIKNTPIPFISMKNCIIHRRRGYGEANHLYKKTR